MKRLLSLGMMLFSLTAFAWAGHIFRLDESFDGPDGQVVAPSATWGYTNVGVELDDWATHPRPDAEDRYIITNNALYCYVGPTDVDALTYNKVQAVIRPITPNGSNAFFRIPAGISMQYDLLEAVANEGHRWNLNQELKLSLTPIALNVDPVGIQTNACQIQLTVQPLGSPGIRLQTRFCHHDGGGWVWSNIVDTVMSRPTSTNSLQLRMDVRQTGQVSFYTNGTLSAESEEDALPSSFFGKAYVQFWHGKFNGDGGVSADGYVVIDNLRVQPIRSASVILVK